MGKATRLNLDNELFANLAKMEIPSFVTERSVIHVPVIKDTHIQVAYPTASATINYATKEIKLEKIKYAEPQLHKSHVLQQQSYWDMIKSKAQRDIYQLRMNDIPVLNIESNAFPSTRNHFNEEIVFEYQIPEQLMYKSFFVLYDFNQAVKKGGEYALQQVQKVIDKY